MAMLEEPHATWDKRYKQKHYSYRDSHQVQTQVLTALQTLGLAAQTPPSPLVLYLFGANARFINPNNWPQKGDTIGTSGQTRVMSCYAREVMVRCDQNCWVRFVSLNPDYIRFLGLGYTAQQLSAMGVPSTIMETENWIPMNDDITFYPTLGVTIIFRADTVQGTLNISVEGNVEGTE